MDSKMGIKKEFFSENYIPSSVKSFTSPTSNSNKIKSQIKGISPFTEAN